MRVIGGSPRKVVPPDFWADDSLEEARVDKANEQTEEEYPALQTHPPPNTYPIHKVKRYVSVKLKPKLLTCREQFFRSSLLLLFFPLRRVCPSSFSIIRPLSSHTIVVRVHPQQSSTSNTLTTRASPPIPPSPPKSNRPGRRWRSSLKIRQFPPRSSSNKTLEVHVSLTL
jgi:hypothetical protein